MRASSECLLLYWWHECPITDGAPAPPAWVSIWTDFYFVFSDISLIERRCCFRNAQNYQPPTSSAQTKGKKYKRCFLFVAQYWWKLYMYVWNFHSNSSICCFFDGPFCVWGCGKELASNSNLNILVITVITNPQTNLFWMPTRRRSTQPGALLLYNQVFPRWYFVINGQELHFKFLSFMVQFWWEFIRFFQFFRYMHCPYGWYPFFLDCVVLRC